MLKTAFVAFDGSPSARAAVEVVCFLVAPERGKLYLGEVIELPADPALTTGMMADSLEYLAAVPPAQTAADVETYLAERQAVARDHLAQAAAVCRAWPTVTCETLCLNGFVEEEILNQAASVDLIALGKWSRPEAGKKIGRLARALVHQAPRPVLVATDAAQPPDQLIALYDGKGQAVQALTMGVEIARGTGLPLLVASAAATRAESEALGRRAAQYLRDHETPFEPLALHGREGVNHLLVGLLREHPHALALMGTFEGSRVREWLAGGTTRAILKETSNPVLLVR